MSPPVPPVLEPTTAPMAGRAPTTTTTTAPTTAATSQPATMPAAVKPTQFAGSIAFCLIIALAGVAVARACGWWRDARWSLPRAPTVASTGPLWLGLGAMVLVGIVIVPAALASAGLSGATPPGAERGVNDDARLMLATTLTYLAGLAAMAGVHAVGNWRAVLVRLGITEDFPRARRDAAVVIVGLPILIGLTNLAMVVAQFAWWLLEYQHSSAHALLQLMQRAEAMPVVLVLAIVNAVVLAPVFEEVFFRGHLQTALTAILPSRWPAIAITSVLFAAMHEPWTIPAILVLSLIIGYVYERTGNLWVAIGLHVGFNGASTLLFLITRGVA